MAPKKNKKKKITRSVTMSLNRDKELKMYKKINRHFDITKEKTELMSFINTVLQKISSKLLVLNLLSKANMELVESENESINELITYYKDEITKLKTSVQICEQIKSSSDPVSAFEAVTIISSTIMDSCVKMEEMEEKYNNLIKPHSDIIKKELELLINNPEEASHTREELIDFIDDDDTTDIKVVEVNTNGERESEENKDFTGSEISGTN